MSGSAHTPAASVSHPMISDERLENATGRSRRHWYRELDEVGAQEWDRKRIARWLGVKREVDAWWAQALAIDYERDRGLRDGGRGRDGAQAGVGTASGTRGRRSPGLSAAPAPPRSQRVVTSSLMTPYVHPCRW